MEMGYLSSNLGFGTGHLLSIDIIMALLLGAGRGMVVLGSII